MFGIIFGQRSCFRVRILKEKKRKGILLFILLHNFEMSFFFKKKTQTTFGVTVASWFIVDALPFLCENIFTKKLRILVLVFFIFVNIFRCTVCLFLNLHFKTNK